jgi:hypothetical protein
VIRLYSFLLLIAIQLHAFEDDDIDGVENSKDLCPNTSFEDTVNDNGCPEDNNYWGKITLSIGSDINIDDSTTTDYNFFSNYNYKAWDFSLYSSQQSAIDTNNNETQSAGDLYISSSYSKSIENIYIKTTLGTKLATGDKEISTGESDYFTNLYISYALTNDLAILSSIGYTLTGDSNETNYNNSLGYSLSMGYMANDKWYSSLTYQNSDSIYEDSENYQSISLFNSYNFTRNFFGTITYTKGLDELSYDQTISLRLGVNFE